jgi:predicted thioesterase
MGFVSRKPDSQRSWKTPPLNAIRAYLDPGESAVGTAVNVRHLAATPVARLVTGEAEVTKVDGRQIEFTTSRAWTWFIIV